MTNLAETEYIERIRVQTTLAERRGVPFPDGRPARLTLPHSII